MRGDRSGITHAEHDNVAGSRAGRQRPGGLVRRILSSPLHRVQAPCLGFELLNGLLDRRSFVGRPDGAEPHTFLAIL